ncbi:MAG: FKBP-type peptidyl-prolyl cis-trans isomerase [Tannerella sp.]|jgi:peptidylprolyl isomerase/FKBP-type peptidyl-prolyl cis-trans isomerase FklB|nr:FKBP-type peptidyl-prolyl cis-trans isomerase [Tannerella sp.]
MEMKKYGYYIITAVMALTFAPSCGDDEVDHLDAWMLDNQQVLNSIKSNPEYRELKSPGNEGSIYYRVLNKGAGKDSIYYTSTVSCYYKGWFVADYPYYSITKNQVFDKKQFDDGSPFSLIVGSVSTGGVIGGWRTVLQHMVEGDKWEVWVPYQLAYGRESLKDSSGNVSIPGYSTLAFEIEVVKVKQ